jgi:hypothetical protein
MKAEMVPVDFPARMVQELLFLRTLSLGNDYFCRFHRI